MVGTTGRWSVLIIVVCWGRLSASNTVETICPKPVIPEDTILVLLQSDLNLTCAGCDGRGSWSRRSPHGTPPSLTESGHLHAVTYEDEDNYTCYQDGAPVCSVQLIVRDEPQENTSLSCYHRHPTHNISCKWKPTGPLHPSSSVTLIKAIITAVPVFSGCSYDAGRETFSCSVPHNEGDTSRQNFYVCVSGRTDSQLAASLNADGRDLLRIGPPLNVQVTPVKNHPRRLRVCWSRPEFWKHKFYSLRYQVLYMVENSLQRSNGTTEDAEESFIIHDAVMGRKHLIRVRAREEFQKENWGSWSEEVAGVPWSDGTATTLVPSEYTTPTSKEEEDNENEDKAVERILVMTPRSVWIVPCVAFGLGIFFFLGLWIRYQEIKVLKLKWSFLRSLFHPSSKANPTQPSASELPLMSSPSSVVITVPPLQDGE